MMNPTFVVSTVLLICLQYYLLDSSSTILSSVHAFQGSGGRFHQPFGRISILPPPQWHQQEHRRQRPTSKLFDATSDISPSSLMTSEVEQFLQQEHPMFYALLLYKNEYVWKMIRNNGDGACTIFAPTDAAMETLGTKKIQQLQDNRNDEIRNKIGSYHIILDDTDLITTRLLCNSGGIRTIATGENPIVLVERTRPNNGNIFAMFTSKNNDNDDDGTVTLGSNNAKIINTIYIQNSNTLIHQIDALISPNILWRYCDQLRIPGT